MAFYQGDIPTRPLEVVPPETVELEDYVNADAVVIDPVGEEYADDITATIGADDITVTLPSFSLFTMPGIFRLRIQLDGPDGTTRLPDSLLVVQADGAAWHNLDTIRAEWPDAEFIADATLYELLEVVKVQVLTFAPALAAGAAVPSNYRLGQRVQTRNVWNATKVAPDGSTGSDDFVIRPFPLDWHVKAILRPTRGVPVLG